MRCGECALGRFITAKKELRATERVKKAERAKTIELAKLLVDSSGFTLRGGGKAKLDRLPRKAR